MIRNRFYFMVMLSLLMITSCTSRKKETKWVKYENNPVLGGGDLGTVFDIAVLKEDGVYKMYSSWRPKKSIALSVSTDGMNWTKPEIVLGPNKESGWEDDLNRPVVVKKDGIYHLWYTGFSVQEGSLGKSYMGYATSPDGKNFTRQSDKPVLSPEEPWEKENLMCPHVIWDEQAGVFKMWYSGGEISEPDAIGYATGKDGLHWEKYAGNPVFSSDPSNSWEQDKVTACQVIKRNKDYLMFYIGFYDVNLARIGMAKSPDGIGNWVRFDGNPIIFPTPDSWDASACYKPFAIREKDRWMLWYNGRNESLEQIGLAIFDDNDLGF